VLCKKCAVEMAIISTKLIENDDQTSMYEQRWACMNKNCDNYDSSWEKKEEEA